MEVHPSTSFLAVPSTQFDADVAPAEKLHDDFDGLFGESFGDDVEEGDLDGGADGEGVEGDGLVGVVGLGLGD